MLLINQNKIIWATNLLISAALLIMLISSKRAFVMLILGALFAFAAKSILSFSPATIHLSHHDSIILAASYAVISIGLIVSLNTVFSNDIMAKEEEIMCIAHEAKAPFATCYVNIASIEDMISSLKFNSSSNASLSKDDINHISHTLSKLKSICTEGINSISSILHTNSAPLEPINLKDLIDCVISKIGDNRICNTITSDYFVDGYKISIQVAIENILKNASVHSQASKICIYVSNNTITIEDDGIGISEDKLKLIFDDGHTTSESGSGYGLGIAKRIIEQHSGSIYIDSDQNNYTKCIINLNNIYAKQ